MFSLLTTQHSCEGGLCTRGLNKFNYHVSCLQNDRIGVLCMQFVSSILFFFLPLLLLSLCTIKVECTALCNLPYSVCLDWSKRRVRLVICSCLRSGLMPGFAFARPSSKKKTVRVVLIRIFIYLSCFL